LGDCTLEPLDITLLFSIEITWGGNDRGDRRRLQLVALQNTHARPLLSCCPRRQGDKSD
jgi:hypothetical protein